jgi:hypothetical protein
MAGAGCAGAGSGVPGNGGGAPVAPGSTEGAGGIVVDAGGAVVCATIFDAGRGPLALNPMFPCADAVPEIAMTVVSPAQAAKNAASTLVLSRFNIPSTSGKKEHLTASAVERFSKAHSPRHFGRCSSKLRR